MNLLTGMLRLVRSDDKISGKAMTLGVLGVPSDMLVETHPVVDIAWVTGACLTTHREVRGLQICDQRIHLGRVIIMTVHFVRYRS